jgi:hypothetical protein
MTNENQKKNSLKKYKFLVPIFVFFVAATVACVNMSKINRESIILIAVMAVPFLTSAFFHYKYEFDKKWKEQRDKRIWEEKDLARKYKYNISAQFDGLIMLLFIGVCMTIYSIVKNLLNHEFANAIILIIFAVFVFVLIKILNKFFSK